MLNKFLRGIAILPFVHLAFLYKPMANTYALSGLSFIFVIFLIAITFDWKEVDIVDIRSFPYIWLWAFAQTIYFNSKGVYVDLDRSLTFLLHISGFFLLYYSVLKSRVDWKYVTRPLAYTCMIISILAIFEKLGAYQFKSDLGVVMGMLGNSTNTAMYIAATSPFLIAYKRGWLWFWIPVVAIYMLASTSGLIGIGVVIVFYLGLKEYWWRYFLACGIVGISLGLTNVFNFAAHGKVVMWLQALEAWKGSSWFGYCIGHFQKRYPGISTTTWHFAHNHYLWILYTMGLIGLFLLFLFLIRPLRNGWLNRKEVILPLVSVISVMAMSTCSVPMRVYPIMILTAFNLGILAKDFKVKKIVEWFYPDKPTP